MFPGTSSIWANSLGNICQESQVPGSLLRSRRRSGAAPWQDRQAVVLPGSFALQLAADHPDRVSRLVVAGTAYRPGPVDRRRVQQDVADLAAGGRAGAPSGRSPYLRRVSARSGAPRRPYVALGPSCDGARLGTHRCDSHDQGRRQLLPWRPAWRDARSNPRDGRGEGPHLLTGAATFHNDRVRLMVSAEREHPELTKWHLQAPFRDVSLPQTLVCEMDQSGRARASLGPHEQRGRSSARLTAGSSGDHRACSSSHSRRRVRKIPRASLLPSSVIEVRVCIASKMGAYPTNFAFHPSLM